MTDKPSTETITQSILDGNTEVARTLAESCLQAGLEPLDALAPFVSSIRQAGNLFDQGEFFLPQLLLSAQAMQAAMSVLFPDKGEGSARISRGKVIAGTIQGDIHEIGKNLVCALLSANGFDVIDLGANVAMDRFVEETRNQRPDFLVLSALLTTTMVNQKNLIDMLKENGLRQDVKVLVGGAPVTKGWAKEIGADGWAPDAARAVDLAIGLLDK